MLAGSGQHTEGQSGVMQAEPYSMRLDHGMAVYTPSGRSLWTSLLVIDDSCHDVNSKFWCAGGVLLQVGVRMHVSCASRRASPGGPCPCLVLGPGARCLWDQQQRQQQAAQISR